MSSRKGFFRESEGGRIPANLTVGYTAAIVLVAAVLLYMYFSWRKQERNADISYLCTYPAVVVIFLFNGSPMIFKVIVVPAGAIALALSLYRLRKRCSVSSL